MVSVLINSRTYTSIRGYWGRAFILDLINSRTHTVVLGCWFLCDCIFFRAPPKGVPSVVGAVHGLLALGYG